MTPVRVTRALAPGVVAAAPSGIRDVANAALLVPDAIRLDLGQPDFRTPHHISEAGKRAIERGDTQYTHTQGRASLREAISAKLARVNGVNAVPEEIACSGGGVGAVAASFAAVLSAGDEVLIPDPAWPNFRLICSWLQARPVAYPCPADRGFQPDLEAIERLITPRTRLIVVNSPNNPTGAVYPRVTLQAIAALAEAHDLWLLSDECYDELLFRGDAPGLSRIVEDERLISVFSFSKTYAMTGWRIGYAVARGEAMTSIAKVLESNTSCASSISQAAAEAALAGPQDVVADMVASYRERRDAVVEVLAGSGLLLAVPEGAFYAMVDITSSGLSSRDFAFALLEAERVSVAPGSAFGETATGAVRVSLASAVDDLREGVARLRRHVERLNGDSTQRGRG